MTSTTDPDPELREAIIILCGQPGDLDDRQRAAMRADADADPVTQARAVVALYDALMSPDAPLWSRDEARSPIRATTPEGAALRAQATARRLERARTVERAMWNSHGILDTLPASLKGAADQRAAATAPPPADPLIVPLDGPESA